MSEHESDSRPPARGAAEPRRRRQVLVAEVVVAVGAVVGLAALPQFSAGQGALKLDHPLVLSAALLYLPLIPYLQRRISLEEMGVRAAGAGRSVLLALASAAAIFPLFVLLWWLVGGALVGLPPLGAAGPSRGPSFWFIQSATQVLAVALPEEWFFRGYLQRRLKELFPGGVGWGNLRLSAAVVLAAVAFGLAHAVRYAAPLRFNVFFPGLLFGWVRERGDHLAGPVLLHAGSNLLLSALAGGG